MNYDRYAQDPLNSAIFNGNSSSMSGNGKKSGYKGVPQGFRAPYNMIPADQGGGCVTTGPFKEYALQTSEDTVKMG
jgi:tyrosinase